MADSFDLDRARFIALDLAQQAGDHITSAFATNVPVHEKSDGSPVTDVDLAINQLVVDTLSAAYPDCSVLAEEGSRLINGATDMWVCDPLDGTLMFTMGLPLSTFALALVRDGVPVLGVIAYPFRELVAVATLESGTTVNGVPVNVASKSSLDGVVLDASTGRKSTHFIPGLFDALDLAGTRNENAGSCSLGALLIAAGKLDGAVSCVTTPWDAAAGKILIEQAGGVFTALDGKDQRYDRPIRGYIAGNSAVHGALSDIVSACGVVSRPPVPQSSVSQSSVSQSS